MLWGRPFISRERRKNPYWASHHYTTGMNRELSSEGKHRKCLFRQSAGHQVYSRLLISGSCAMFIKQTAVRTLKRERHQPKAILDRDRKFSSVRHVRPRVRQLPLYTDQIRHRALWDNDHASTRSFIQVVTNIRNWTGPLQRVMVLPNPFNLHDSIWGYGTEVLKVPRRLYKWPFFPPPLPGGSQCIPPLWYLPSLSSLVSIRWTHFMQREVLSMGLYCVCNMVMAWKNPAAPALS